MPDCASSLFSFFDDSDGFWFTKPRWKALPNVKREAAAKGKKYSTYKPISFLLLHSSCMSYSFCSRFSHEEQWDHCLPTPTQHRQYVETRRKRREKTHTVSYMHNHKPCTTLERGVYTPSYTNESPLLSLTLREKSSEGKFEKTEEKKSGVKTIFSPPLYFTDVFQCSFNGCCRRLAYKGWKALEARCRETMTECEEKGRGSDREKKKYILGFYLMVTLQRQVSCV